MNNICIAYPNHPIFYSETFIKMHRDNLPWDFKICHGRYPCLNENGKPILSFPFNNLWLRGITRRLSSSVYEKQYTKQLALYLKKNQIKLVFAEYGHVGANIFEACQISNVSLVVHFHGFDAYHYPTIQLYGEKYKAMFRYAHQIIAVSKDMIEQLIKLGAERQKIIYSPYGIDVEKFGGAEPINSSPIFLSVGRFAPKKAPHLTIQAFAKILKEVPKAILQMVGEGQLLEKCRELVVEMGIEKQVDFKGILTPMQISELMQKARAFVQHSIRADDGDSEGTPVSVLEASASGLPVISTRHGGIKDVIIENETGILVDEKDIEGMAQAMLLLANNPKIADEMGKKGREIVVKNYTLQKNLDKLKNVITPFKKYIL